MASDIYWFSADSRDRVVAKTVINRDGSVTRYQFTVPDNPHAGHGHAVWNTIEKFLKDHPEEADWERKANHPDSINRKWKGNG